MQYITQSKYGLKHISFLRRIFLKKLSGKIKFNFSPENQKHLLLHQGKLLGEITTLIPILRDCLSKPVPSFVWEATPGTTKTSGGTAPWIILSEALRDLPLDNQRLASYHQAFSKLPPMVLKSWPSHRINFADSESYMILYHLSLGAPSFDLNIFFLGNLTEEKLTQHVRAVLLLFLLGYLRAAPKEESTNKNISIVSRILKRFKAKGAV